MAAAEEGEIGERAAVADDEAILEVDLAGVGGGDEAEGLDQGGFTRAARAEQRGDGALREREAHVVEGLHGGRAAPVGLAQMNGAYGLAHGQPSRARAGSMRDTCTTPSMLARVTITKVTTGAIVEMASVTSTRRGNIG